MHESVPGRVSHREDKSGLEEQQGSTTPSNQESVSVGVSATDTEYAQNYWAGMTESGRAVQVASFEATVQDAEETGTISQFVSVGELTKEDREKLSARRQFYCARGYWVGKYTYHANSGTAVAPILNVNRLKEISQRCTAIYEGKYTAPLFEVTVVLDEVDLREINRLLSQTGQRLTELAVQYPNSAALQSWEKLLATISQDLHRYTADLSKGTSASLFGHNLKEAYRFLKETSS
jgi:hypothetical protein